MAVLKGIPILVKEHLCIEKSPSVIAQQSFPTIEDIKFPLTAPDGSKQRQRKKKDIIYQDTNYATLPDSYCIVPPLAS